MLSSQQEDCRLQLLCELGVPSLIEAVILLRRYQLESPDTILSRFSFGSPLIFELENSDSSFCGTAGWA